MRPEIEIILLSLKNDLDSEAETRLAALLSRDLDWHFLSVAAVGHKICPPLDTLLEDHGVNSNLTVLIRQESKEIQRKGMMLTARLFKLQKVLLESGIEFAFVKGAVVSNLLYGTVKKRAFSDIDLFVKSQSVPRLAQILEQEGFFPTPMWCHCHHPNEFFRSPKFIKLDHEKEYASKNNSFAVDLHWGPGTRFATCDQMLKHTSEKEIAGHTVRTLEPNLHFVYLCAHAAKHDWDTLVWISDFARALESENIFNWRKIARLSRKLGLFGTVQTSVCLANRLLGAEIPQALLPIKPTLEKVSDQIIRRYDRAVPPVVSFSKVPHWRRIWHTYDSKLQVAEQVAVDLFKPTFSDWVRIKLPDNLFWLYYLTRPASKVYYFGTNTLKGLLSKKPNRTNSNAETDNDASAKEHEMWERITSGEKLNDPEKLSRAYKRILTHELRAHAIGEYAGAKVYESWVGRAPDAVSKERLEKLTRDEYKHARMIMALLEPFGFTRKELEDEFNKTSLLGFFSKPVESWSELIVFNLLVDGAADQHLHDFSDCSWEPWCKAMRLIQEDEVTHLANSDKWIEEAARDPVTKAQVQTALNEWFPRIDTVFGQSKWKQNQEACIFKIRLRRCDEVRKLWHEELEKKLKKYDYVMPTLQI